MNTMKIDLGKGLTLEAPIKLNMTLDEWLRMTKHINSLLNLKKK